MNDSKKTIRINQEIIEMKLERKIKLDKPYDVKALKLAKTLFPFFLRLLKIKRIISGGKINIINNCYYNKNEKPVIFAITHVGKYDIERVYEALNEHSILLFGTPEDVHGTFDGFMLEKILVNYLDINDKEDRKVVKRQMIKDLKNGANIMWFPEGTWNISPNLLVLPIRYGIIEVALEANVPIVPIALEYDLDNKIYYINIGENFYANKYLNKIDAITELRDTLATLKWEIFEGLSLKILILVIGIIILIILLVNGIMLTLNKKKNIYLIMNFFTQLKLPLITYKTLYLPLKLHFLLIKILSFKNLYKI